MVETMVLAGPGATGVLRLPTLSRRLGAALAVVAFAAYLVAAQGLPLRAGAPAQPARTAASVRPADALQQPATSEGGAAAEAAGIDVGGVVETVSHALRPLPGRPGAWESLDERYRATFDDAGFALEGFRVTLASLAQGGTATPLRSGPWQAEANVATRTMAAGVSERVTSRDGELQWDLVLDRPLRGDGDLVAEATFTGAHQGSAGDAVVFEAGRDTVRMGQLVVFDAAGAELHRAVPEVAGDRLRLTVPAEALDRAAYPVTLDPTVGLEVPVTGAGEQWKPAVAFDGTNYLVVWEDYRTGSSADIYGARVSTSGTVLDATGIAISTADGGQTHPAVAFDGTNFLVVWWHLRSGPSDIYGARVSSTGGVIDPSGIAVSTAAGSQVLPALAFDGTRYLVVWGDRRSGSWDVYAARVDTAGTVLDPQGIAVSTAAHDQTGPAVAFGGGNYLVVWQDTRSNPGVDVYAARVDTAGAVLDGTGIPVSTAAGQLNPSVAFDGTTYLVVWEHGVLEAPDIYGARVTTGGTVLDPRGIPVSTATSSQQRPTVAFDGTNYLVVWTDNRSGTATPDVYGTRVSPAGSVLDATGFAVSTAPGRQWEPAVAFDGTNHLVVWDDERSGGSDIHGARVATSGAVLDPTGFPVAPIAPGAHSQPAVAFDGTNYLVVWSDERSGPADLYATRVNPSGAVLDGTGIPVSTAPGGQFDPAVAFDGTNYLVVWEDNRSGATLDAFGARVSTAGAVLDRFGLRLSTAVQNEVNPAVAFDGTNYLVVWQDTRLGSPDVYGTRVSRAGSVLDATGIPVSTASGNQLSPAVAFDGTNHLVVWEDYRFGAFANVYGARVSTGGSVLDPAGLAVSAASNSQTTPAIAFNGTDHLVVWSDFRSFSTWDVYAARVTPGGSVRDVVGVEITTAAGDQTAPVVAVNGPALVAWQDRRSGGLDVYATRVRSDLERLDGDGVAVARASSAETFPAVAAGPAGDERFGVVYERFVSGAPFDVDRAFFRTFAK